MSRFAFITTPPTTRAPPSSCPKLSFLPATRPLRPHIAHRRPPARIVPRQCQQADSSSSDASSRLPSTMQFKIEDDDTFVLEDDNIYADPDEHLNVIWNRLPTTAPFLPSSFLSDILIILSIVAIVYGLVLTTGYLFSTTPYASLTIDTSLSVLPWYAAQSLTRMFAGYAVSLAFSLSYAYVAYRFKFAANLLILAIDVLQSIPLLSFLPGVVLGLIAIFPGARIGVELASVLLLFTSMAWNMLLGFYQALCCIPRDFLDVADSFKLSAWKRFWTLELPAGAIGLVWNSVISVAGGWFFLISIESFELGNRDFKLPGLGSFLAVAAENADTPAILFALLTVITIIVLIDFLIWRPLIAWSAKFTHGASDSASRPRSAVLNVLQRSSLFRSIHTSFFAPAWEAFVNLGSRNPFTGEVLATTRHLNAIDMSPSPTQKSTSSSSTSADWKVVFMFLQTGVQGLVLALLGAGVGYSVFQAARLVNVIPAETWLSIFTAAVATFGRVLVALALSLLWTVPAGVAIGRSPRLSTMLQPVVQIAASVPATALFPFLLLFLVRLGGGLEVGSIALMMLGTMWYILFNVIAGAQAIPAELFEVDSVYNRGGGLKKWTSLILPGIFPYLITGIVTAVGGAWNASIVSEYVVFQGGILKTHGLGALISQAAASGNYAVLLASTVVMSLLVLLTNKFVWSPLYRLSETKYRI